MDMSNKVFLKSIFEANKNELVAKLTGLMLPQDSMTVQKIVSDYLKKMFDGEGDYRQNLTQSEDYILQAALSLLNAQQEMARKTIQACQQMKTEIPHCTSQMGKATVDRDQIPIALGGTLVGGAAGAMLGTWCAVFGAIAGTALILYYASDKKKPKITPKKEAAIKPVGKALDVEMFITIVSKICESIDNLIESFRSQINKMVNKYESAPKPTIESDYRFLLESIQSLIGYERVHDVTEEKYIKKLQIRIEDIAEALENYDLTVENYNVSNVTWFEQVPSAEITTARMVYPAIVKNGQIVLKGKIFIPQN